MDLFKRKPKINTIVDVEVFEKGDKDFYESLLGEISTGSHDVKETIITFPDREVNVRSAAGVIKSAFDSSLNEPLDSRFYWAKDSGDNEANLKPLLGLRPDELFNSYSEFARTSPNSIEVVSSALEAYVVEVIQKTVADFSNHVKVRTEIIHESKNAKKIEENDFFSLTVAEAKAQIERLADSEKLILNTLSIARFEGSQVTLDVENTSYIAAADAERFIFAAAESKATLEQVKSLSAGFIWLHVLEGLAKMVEAEIIKISFPGSEAELPDIFELENNTNTAVQDYLEIANPFDDDEELINKSLVLDAKPLEGIIVEMVNSPGEEFVFGSSVEDDDGSFMYELLRDDDSNLFTDGVADNIEDDVRKVLSHETVSEAVKNEVIVYLRRNNVLEAELTSIEKSIADGRGRYNKNVEVFEDLRHQNALTSFDDSEIGREVHAAVDTIKEKQDNSNNAFFAVSKLEEERYRINSERRAILTKMSSIISEMFGEGVQGILHRIDLKLSGIERVSNVAFHAPEDDEVEDVDPSLLKDLTSHTVVSQSKKFSYDETPTFFILTKQFGFNPFETAASTS